jgi:hypothetical protein
LFIYKRKKLHACHVSLEGPELTSQDSADYELPECGIDFAVVDERCCMLAFNRLRVDLGDGSPVVDYRIANGCVECRVIETNTELANGETPDSENGWNRLKPEELSAHVLAGTVVARWLSRRMGIFSLVQACHPECSSNNPDCSPNNNEEQRSNQIAA